MIAALWTLTAFVAQDPDLAAVRALEARRVEVMARVAQAVCSVMDMEQPGGGSGVVIDPAGFVLTNFHVVGQPDKNYKPPEPPEPPADAPDPQAWLQAWRDEHLPKGRSQYRNKKVGLPDGLLYEAVVLGIDPGSDLAVLRLLPKEPGQRWPWCALGDSDELLVGETVFAMGNPFLLATDFTPTVTFGIVSGTHRYQEGGGNRMLVYPDCIQVDAPVNPGNSGGPLFNEKGEVVGINGRISIGDRGRVNVGVGFAIASNQVKNFLGDLLAGRHAEHGTLDMSAWYMDAPRETTPRRGVFVQQMFSDAVVGIAGLTLGDEITQFNGIAVRSANQLATLIGVLPAGAWVTLGFRPALEEGGYGPERLVTVRLAVLDTGSSRGARDGTERLASRENRRIATRSLLERMASQPTTRGMRVELVSPDGKRIVLLRQGEGLRVERDGMVWVRTAAGDGFALRDGAVEPLPAEAQAWLDREFAANALLWPVTARREQLAAALLLDGPHILGAPSFRFELPGDGELSTMVFHDGAAAGHVLRDPLRRAKVEWHYRGDALRVIVDGRLEPGWQLVPPQAVALDPVLFRRPR